MMNDLKSKIEEYIKNDRINLGFEINSAWGTGKTYSVTKIQSEIKSSKYKYVWINISFNGLTERDIDGLVQSSIAASLVKPLGKVIKNAGIGIGKLINMVEYNGVKLNIPSSFLSTQPNIIKLKEQLKEDHIKPIFVFDDVERIQNKSAIAKLFGVIATTLQEQLNAHVIIIVNENELDKEVKEFFLKNREKIVAHVTTLSTEKNSAVATILNELSGHKETEVIEEIHNKIIESNGTNVINLRTLTVFVSLFNTIWEELADHLTINELTCTQIHDVYRELALFMYNEVRQNREMLRNDVDSTADPKAKSQSTNRDHNLNLMYISNKDGHMLIDFINQGLPIDSVSFALRLSQKFTLLKNNDFLKRIIFFRDNSEESLKQAQYEFATSDDLSNMLNNISEVYQLYSAIVFFETNNLWLIDQDKYEKLSFKLKELFATYSLHDLQNERQLLSINSVDNVIMSTLDDIIANKLTDSNLSIETTEKIMNGDHNSVIELFNNSDMKWRDEITRILIGNMKNNSNSFQQRKNIIIGLSQNYTFLSELYKQQYKDALDTITTTPGDAVLKRIAKETNTRLPSDKE